MFQLGNRCKMLVPIGFDGCLVVVKEEGGERGSMDKCLLINDSTNELVNQLFFKIEEHWLKIFLPGSHGKQNCRLSSS
jgi:hypothetical protein